MPVPSITNTDRVLDATAVAAQAEFVIAWPVFADSEAAAVNDLVVLIDGRLVDTADFNFVGTAVAGVAGVWNGGTVALDTACVGGERVIIFSDRAPRRVGYFLEGKSLPFTELDKLLDDLVSQVRDLQLKVKRGVTISISDYLDGGDPEGVGTDILQAAQDAVNAAASAGSNIWARPVLSIQGATPGSPAIGDRYLVAHSATSGAFAGHEDQAAEWSGSAWLFSGAPKAGQALWVTASNRAYIYRTDGWHQRSGKVIRLSDFPLATCNTICNGTGVALEIDEDLDLSTAGADTTIQASKVTINGGIITLGAHNLIFSGLFVAPCDQVFVRTGVGTVQFAVDFQDRVVANWFGFAPSLNEIDSTADAARTARLTAFSWAQSVAKALVVLHVAQGSNPVERGVELFIKRGRYQVNGQLAPARSGMTITGPNSGVEIISTNVGAAILALDGFKSGLRNLDVWFDPSLGSANPGAAAKRPTAANTDAVILRILYGYDSIVENIRGRRFYLFARQKLNDLGECGGPGGEQGDSTNAMYSCCFNNLVGQDSVGGFILLQPTSTGNTGSKWSNIYFNGGSVLSDGVINTQGLSAIKLVSTHEQEFTQLNVEGFTGGALFEMVTSSGATVNGFHTEGNVHRGTDSYLFLFDANCRLSIRRWQMNNCLIQPVSGWVNMAGFQGDNSSLRIEDSDMFAMSGNDGNGNPKVSNFRPGNTSGSARAGCSIYMSGVNFPQMTDDRSAMAANDSHPVVKEYNGEVYSAQNYNRTISTAAAPNGVSKTLTFDVSLDNQSFSTRSYMLDVLWKNGTSVGNTDISRRTVPVSITWFTGGTSDVHMGTALSADTGSAPINGAVTGAMSGGGNTLTITIPCNNVSSSNQPIRASLNRLAA